MIVSDPQPEDLARSDHAGSEPASLIYGPGIADQLSGSNPGVTVRFDNAVRFIRDLMQRAESSSELLPMQEAEIAAAADFFEHASREQWGQERSWLLIRFSLHLHSADRLPPHGVQLFVKQLLTLPNSGQLKISRIWASALAGGKVDAEHAFTVARTVLESFVKAGPFANQRADTLADVVKSAFHSAYAGNEFAEQLLPYCLTLARSPELLPYAQEMMIDAVGCRLMEIRKEQPPEQYRRISDDALEDVRIGLSDLTSRVPHERAVRYNKMRSDIDFDLWKRHPVGVAQDKYIAMSAADRGSPFYLQLFTVDLANGVLRNQSVRERYFRIGTTENIIALQHFFTYMKRLIRQYRARLSRRGMIDAGERLWNELVGKTWPPSASASLAQENQRAMLCSKLAALRPATLTELREGEIAIDYCLIRSQEMLSIRYDTNDTTVSKKPA